MDDTARVRVVERRRDLRDEPDRLAERQAAALREQRLQRPALHQLHHDEAHRRRLHDVVRDDDVRVPQPGRDLRLAGEALLDVLERRRLDERVELDPLHRHVAAEHAVAGAVDLAEGARAQPRHDAIALAEQPRERLASRRARGVGELELRQLVGFGLRLIARPRHPHHPLLDRPHDAEGWQRC